MLTFNFRGEIADIDDMATGDGTRRSRIVVLEVDGGLQRVEFPEVLFQQVRTMLCPGRAVLIDGEVSQLGNEALRHIADAVHFLDQGH